ncbi:transglutaminase-like cysteine peptidase [Alsobacter sp. KACC 23698]|uniref:Transglutaminase-like cysteine peptidase n=1 Tax=Alsobacter sp. KACC 23698 TaxID=3149229 RepID=A0AAU7JE86_9HYPH
MSSWSLLRRTPIHAATAAVLALAGLTHSGAAAAGERLASLPSPVPPANAAGAARPIAAWQEFCAKRPAECAIDVAEPERVALTPTAWKTIVEINSRVNRVVKPLTDMEHWGVVDRWDFAEDGYGDCEDYQLLKRRMLVSAGFSRRAMPMTVVLDENNEGHAVLMIRTDRGDFVLDNKRDDVLSWQATGYVFVKRESQLETAWVSLNHVSGVTSTASRR